MDLLTLSPGCFGFPGSFTIVNLMRLAFAGRNRDRGGDTNRNNGNPRGNRFGPPPSQEEEDLQKAIDDNAPAGQVKAALEKVREAR